jgi:hypothetical protein
MAKVIILGEIMFCVSPPAISKESADVCPEAFQAAI